MFMESLLFFLKRIGRMYLDGARLWANRPCFDLTHRLEHQPQLVDCWRQVTILLAASIRP